jgi:hypothetical protein
MRDADKARKLEGRQAEEGKSQGRQAGICADWVALGPLDARGGNAANHSWEMIASTQIAVTPRAEVKGPWVAAGRYGETGGTSRERQQRLRELRAVERMIDRWLSSSYDIAPV